MPKNKNETLCVEDLRHAESVSYTHLAELLINGKRVESNYTFTADSETMKVEVAFTFDATSLDGKQLVTFEELYDLSNPDKPKKVTEHKDIEDKGQTITFKEMCIRDRLEHVK